MATSSSTVKFKAGDSSLESSYESCSGGGTAGAGNSGTAVGSTPSNPLYLRKQMTFKPVAPQHIDVFYDQVNGEIFVVNQQPNTHKTLTCTDPCGLEVELIKLPRELSVLSVKQSPLHNILAIQTSPTCIQLRNMDNNIPGSIYDLRIQAKGSSVRIIGFVWTSIKHITIITNQSIELYEVQLEKRNCKTVKIYTINSINWYAFNTVANMLVISTSTLGNLLEAYQFKGSALAKLCKFQVENHISSTRVPARDETSQMIPHHSGVGGRRVTFQNPAGGSGSNIQTTSGGGSGSVSNISQRQATLYDRDVALVLIYSKIRLLVLKNELNTTTGLTRNSIIVYTFVKDGIPKITHTLPLALTGRFAFNSVDDLIIVHHQSSQTSLIFDLHFESGSQHDKTVQPILPPYPIRPFKTDPSSPESSAIELYPCHWVIFQPNIIIDARHGLLWHLDIDLKTIVNMMMDKKDLASIQFLIQRRNSKLVICEYVKRLLIEENLSLLGHIFNKLNSVLTLWEENEKSPKSSGKTWSKLEVIDQAAMITYVFSSFDQSSMSGSTQEFILFALLEYLHSLINHSITVEHSIYELLINLLVKTRQFYLLNQLTMYKILSDSKPLACLLLSLEKDYPAATQLALDMLKRLGHANEDIVDILLAKGRVIQALRFIESTGGVDAISARQYLQASLPRQQQASSTTSVAASSSTSIRQEKTPSDDLQTFLTVYTFFLRRNETLRGCKDFVPGEKCEKFVSLYESIVKKKGSNDNGVA